MIGFGFSGRFFGLSMDIYTMRMILFLFLFCNLSAIGCISISLNQNGRNIRYTTASTLNVRSKPTMNSKRISQVPYGTKIEVRKTKNKETIDGISDFWYYSEDVLGYVFGAYLSRERPAFGRKKRYLKIRTEGGICNSESVVHSDTLILYDNIVSLYKENQIYYDYEKSHQKGSYRFSKGVLIIDLKEGEGIKEIFNDDSPSKKIFKAKSFSSRYLWNEKLKGYVTQEQRARFFNKEYTVNIKRCFFFEKKYKKPFNNIEEFCKIYENVHGKSFVFEGYLCSR